jgi:alpha-galactosidase
LFRQFARVFDVFTFPSDDHIGEYVAFGSEFHGIQWPYGLENKSIRLAPEPAPDLLEEYASGRLPEGDARILAGSHEMTVPIIWDIELDRGIVRPAVNVLNTRGYIDNLPRDIVVEVPGKVDATGVHPLPVGCLPEAFAAFMRPQFTIHGLVTEAYRTHSKKLLLQALLLDPVVNHSTAAEKMLDQMLTAQKDFLPEFS